MRHFLLLAVVLLHVSALSLAAHEPKPFIVVKLDTSEVPELETWGHEAKDLIVEWYPRMVNLLGSESYEPTRELGLKFRNSKEGIAHTVGNQITVTSQWVKDHPEDVGLVIHEMVHVIQAYPPRSGPGWITEGIADYLRYAVYEGRPLEWFPTSADPKGFTKGYNLTAGFFLWLENGPAPGIVARLNAHMRRGTYHEDLFKEAGGKPLLELWQDYLSHQRKIRSR